MRRWRRVTTERSEGVVRWARQSVQTPSPQAMSSAKPATVYRMGPSAGRRLAQPTSGSPSNSEPAAMPAPQILRQLPDARVQHDPETIRRRGSSGGHSARPPSAGTTAPVMALLAGLARKARTAATSVGSSSRRMGWWVANVAAAGKP
jgi:hypothetical protein